jgi:hypothetical protein
MTEQRGKAYSPEPLDLPSGSGKKSAAPRLKPLDLPSPPPREISPIAPLDIPGEENGKTGSELAKSPSLDIPGEAHPPVPQMGSLDLPESGALKGGQQQEFTVPDLDIPEPHAPPTIEVPDLDLPDNVASGETNKPR